MKTTFKKTLVASAILAFAGVANAAVDIASGSTAVGFSTERLANTATTVNFPNANLVFEMGAEYAVGDIITLTFSTDAIAASQFLSSVQTSVGTGAGDGGVDQQITLGLLSSTANSVTYRVTEVENATTTIGLTFSVGAAANIAVNAAKLQSAGSLSVTYAAETANGVAIDQGNGSTFQMIYTGSEFAYSVASANRLNGVVDVNNERLTFEGDETEDALTISVSQKTTFEINSAGDTVNILQPVTYVGVEHTVSGDFSWVTDDDTDTAVIDPIADALTVAACTGVADATDATWTVSSVTFECTDAAPTNPVLTFDIGEGDAEAADSVNATAFTASAVITYNAGGTDKEFAVGPINAGAWTLNGSQVRVPYMVVGGSRFGIIANVTNHGSRDGEITLDVFAEDGSTIVSNYPAGTSKAGSVTSVAPALIAALGGSPAAVTKFSFQVTTNVPENDVLVYAAYTDNTTSERAIVNNDSKVQVKGANVDNP